MGLLDSAALKMTSHGAQVHLAMGSSYENIELVQIAVAAALARLDLTERDSGEIALAVREAVANAIKHGTHANPAKRVEVEVEVKDEHNEVEIRVTDQGTGFDPATVKDPRAPENLLRPNGRGLLFMQEYMDEIDYTFLAEGGTRVTLRKRLADSPADSKEEQG